MPLDLIHLAGSPIPCPGRGSMLKHETGYRTTDPSGGFVHVDTDHEMEVRRHIIEWGQDGIREEDAETVQAIYLDTNGVRWFDFVPAPFEGDNPAPVRARFAPIGSPRRERVGYKRYRMRVELLQRVII